MEYGYGKRKISECTLVDIQMKGYNIEVLNMFDFFGSFKVRMGLEG